MLQNVYPVMSRAVTPLLALSFISNLAILISPIFMMQLLDRVIPSGNTATLMLIGALAFLALGLQALVEGARDISLGRLSRWSEREGTAMALHPSVTDQNNLIRHIAGFSAFLNGPAVLAALSLPWLPLFLLVLWLLHPAFLCLVAVMAFLFWTSKSLTSWLCNAATAGAAACADQEASALLRASDVESRIGVSIIAQNLRARFADFQRARHWHLDQGETASTLGSSIGGLIRNSGQISALGLGGWLVTQDLLSAGGMIAGSIITSKAYMAVETALTQFPHIKTAFADYRALSAFVRPQDPQPATVAEPAGELRAENLIFPRGNGAQPRLDRISFSLKAGDCLAIVGAAGSGKSTLLRALSGVSPAPIGSVFLDENEIRGLSSRSLYQMSGYLPQRADIAMGTIAENISGFDPQPDPDAIIDAAKAAGVHGLICALPKSFETDLEEQPYLLSAGQSQRVALARAIYTKPRYLFLDEPNALLDADGERALGQTLLRLKKNRTTIVMAVHKSGILGLADHVMHLDHGRISDYGKRVDVMTRLGIGGRQIEVPLLETSLQDLLDWVNSQFTRAADQEFNSKAKLVCSELFKLGCSSAMSDVLNYAKFSFRFVDDTRCEVRMSGPETTDLSEKIAAVQNKLTKAAENLVHLAQDEARLARISKISEQFEVTNDEDATHYSVTLAVEEQIVPKDVPIESMVQ